MLDAIGDRDIADRQAPIVGGFDPLAGAKIPRFRPSDAFDIPGMIVGDLEYFHFAA
jgi:hypothetical protein